MIFSNIFLFLCLFLQYLFFCQKIFFFFQLFFFHKIKKIKYFFNILFVKLNKNLLHSKKNRFGVGRPRTKLALFSNMASEKPSLNNNMFCSQSNKQKRQFEPRTSTETTPE